MRPRLLVLGIGNTLYGDDGVGPLVVRNLSRRLEMTGVDFIDGGTGGPGLLFCLEGYTHLVVVDAIDAGLAPGTICRFTADGHNTCRTALSMHQAGVGDLLAAARLTGCLPRTVIIGVQAGDLAPGSSLSPQVAARLTGLENYLLEEIKMILRDGQ